MFNRPGLIKHRLQPQHREFRTVVAAAVISGVQLPGVEPEDCIALVDFLYRGDGPARRGELLEFWGRQASARAHLQRVFPEVSLDGAVHPDVILNTIAAAYPATFVAEARSIIA